MSHEPPTDIDRLIEALEPLERIDVSAERIATALEGKVDPQRAGMAMLAQAAERAERAEAYELGARVENEACLEILEALKKPSPGSHNFEGFDAAIDAAIGALKIKPDRQIKPQPKGDPPCNEVKPRT